MSLSLHLRGQAAHDDDDDDEDDDHEVVEEVDCSDDDEMSPRGSCAFGGCPGTPRCTAADPTGERFDGEVCAVLPSRQEVEARWGPMRQRACSEGMALRTAGKRRCVAKSVSWAPGSGLASVCVVNPASPCTHMHAHLPPAGAAAAPSPAAVAAVLAATGAVSVAGAVPAVAAAAGGSGSAGASSLPLPTPSAVTGGASCGPSMVVGAIGSVGRMFREVNMPYPPRHELECCLMGGDSSLGSVDTVEGDEEAACPALEFGAQLMQH